MSPARDPDDAKGVAYVSPPTPRGPSSENGTMLIETLVACVLLTVIMGAVMTLTDGAARLTIQDQERGHVLSQAQVGLYGMTRELRQSYNVVSWSATSFQADVLTVSGNARVTYDCNVAHPTLPAVKRCVRTVGSASRLIVDHVASAAFTYELSGATSTPRYADIKLRIEATGDVKNGHRHEIELHDGFYMRNRDG